MRVTLNIKKDFNLKDLEVFANVRYWEDTDVNGIKDENGKLIPCRNDDLWEPIIDINSGQILNWKQGKTANVHYKVCDEFIYSITDINGDTVIEEDEIYVPTIMCPKSNGYGDYIIMDIDENGYIKDWNKNLIYDLIDDYQKRNNKKL